jgi:hypothetical protein
MFMKVYLDLKAVNGVWCPLTRPTAVLYASVSASFTIEQEGLPLIEPGGESWKWNGDSPQRRLSDLRHRTSL